MKLLRILTLLLAVLALPLSAQAKIFLADTDDTLRVVTASGVTTIHMYAAWADITTTALTPGASDAQVTTATTTVLVAAPGASTYRQIKGLSIRNNHASSSNAITVEFYDGATATELIKYTLLAGETLQWGEDENFRVIDASGQIKAAVDTEMPAAAALADNTANPTAPGVAAFLMCYDGSTWDRCQGGLTDTDDGTIAGSQVPSLTIPLNYVFDGTNWVRETRGTAGTAAAQVLTIQGIASMTPVQVQSNSANIATQTTAAAIQTAVELIDNAVSGAGFNITQMNGVNVSMNSGAHGTGTQRVSVAGPCADPARITHTVISESTAATNEIVALNGSDLIYVCSYKWVTTAANSLNWTRGTGTDCATGTTAIEGAQPFAANGGVAESGGGHPLFVVPAGNALCLVSSVATAHGGRVSYVRTATP